MIGIRLTEDIDPLKINLILQQNKLYCLQHHTIHVVFRKNEIAAQSYHFGCAGVPLGFRKEGCLQKQHLRACQCGIADDLRFADQRLRYQPDGGGIRKVDVPAKPTRQIQGGDICHGDALGLAQRQKPRGDGALGKLHVAHVALGKSNPASYCSPSFSRNSSTARMRSSIRTDCIGSHEVSFR